jgi:type IV pilus assembly protein PilB
MVRLADLLVRDKLISPEQLVAAEAEVKRSSGRFSSVVVKLGSVSEEALLACLARHYKVSSVVLDPLVVAPEVLNLVSEELASKHQLLPFKRDGATLSVAMADPANLFAIDDLKFLTGMNISIFVASDGQIAKAIEKYYRSGSSSAYEDVMSGLEESELAASQESKEQVNVSQLEKIADDAPVVKLVNLMLVDAVKRGASDIHIEPYEKSFRVRYRIDGALYEVMTPPVQLRQAVISRVKIMAALDIAERRLPQDGRIKFKMGKDKEMDYRVSVLPTLFGEKCVLRLLDKGNLQLDMTKLGFEPPTLAAFMHGIHKPFGLVLVTGPTGSGKTTTLYSALSELNKASENISTAEDPVEFNLPGINQVQMHESIGMTFAAALRAFLRQDPDVIMVGEMRDKETCEIGIKAALTGHLVLSTLHTNSAPATISRMLNMGIEPFLITSALNVIVAQRLVKKVCGGCRVPVVVPPQVLRDAQVPEADIPTASLFRGTGCDLCSKTGHKGRIAIYEVMTATDAVRKAILAGVSDAELKAVAIKDGMKTLRQAAVSKLLEGQTTLEEVSRVTAAD